VSSRRCDRPVAKSSAGAQTPGHRRRRNAPIRSWCAASHRPAAALRTQRRGRRCGFGWPSQQRPYAAEQQRGREGAILQRRMASRRDPRRASGASGGSTSIRQRHRAARARSATNSEHRQVGARGHRHHRARESSARQGAGGRRRACRHRCAGIAEKAGRPGRFDCGWRRKEGRAPCGPGADRHCVQRLRDCSRFSSRRRAEADSRTAHQGGCSARAASSGVPLEAAAGLLLGWRERQPLVAGSAAGLLEAKGFVLLGHCQRGGPALLPSQSP